MSRVAPFAFLFFLVAAPAAYAVAKDAPVAVYVSPFKDYRRFQEPKVKPWRESNERVREIGGWKAYANESARAAAPRAEDAPKATNKQESDAAHGVRK